MRLPPAVLAISLGLVAPLAAQVVQHQGLTDWTHLGTAPNWTDDVPEPSADFGLVDQLNQETDLYYASPVYLLDPGTYVASVRVRKTVSQTGVADLTFVVVAGSVGDLTTLAAADQPTDTWVRTANVVFDVTVPQTPVSLFLQNRDTNITKQNYQFDSVRLGRIDVGPVIACESMPLDWGHHWGAPYYTGPVADNDSVFGVAEELSYVWWLFWESPTYTLQPGTYTANVRAKKTVSTAGAYPIDLQIDIGGNVTQVTWAVADQTLNTFVVTPDLTFDITQPNTQVVFRFNNTNTAFQKTNYRFDAFYLRRGSFGYEGTACASSLGTVRMRGAPPQLGRVHRVEIGNAPGIALLIYGVTPQSIDLTAIGMPGCSLYTNVSFSVPLQAQNGTAVSELTMPSIPALAGQTFLNQAVVVDPAANALGLASSQRGRARFSL
ncbi:MAG: hypothetical protein IPM29_29215 [Planctomycetes bacterium]|nr:hypothetical protein [Planctomycetota bacterium]